MWTLWLITFAVGQGSATPAVTPMATYQSQDECQTALGEMFDLIKKDYGTKNTPTPGVAFCVRGNLVKR